MFYVMDKQTTEDLRASGRKTIWVGSKGSIPSGWYAVSMMGTLEPMTQIFENAFRPFVQAMQEIQVAVTNTAKAIEEGLTNAR